MGAYYHAIDIKNDDTIHRIQYFAGPFYWISKAAIHILSLTAPTVSPEDIHTSLVLQDWKGCVIANPQWYKLEAVWWPLPETW